MKQPADLANLTFYCGVNENFLIIETDKDGEVKSVKVNVDVFVDYINTLRKRGTEKREAILLAGQDRIRPIFMTTLTTILALLPLSFGIGEGASLRTPLALAVIGGLVTSTLMTLIVIPVIYSQIDKVRYLRKRSEI